MTKRIHIIGAGPSGLAAALYLARVGLKPIVFEQSYDVGTAFNGSWQCLENWSTEEDVRALLSGLGISTNFLYEPVEASTFFGPARRPHSLQSTRPLFYQLLRGNGEGAFDRGLKEQVLAAGGEIRFNRRVERSNATAVIAATGALKADASVVQANFHTSHPDACYGFLDDRLGPGGHASLLIRDARATLTSWCFQHPNSDFTYLDRSIEAVQAVLGINVISPRRASGRVNFSMSPPWTRGERFFFAGERAGFQDALWGFGLRYAILSGILAARAIAMNEDYNDLCRRFIFPNQEVSLANRVIFRQLGQDGYEWALDKADGQNVMGILRRNYQVSNTKSMLHDIARQGIHPILAEPDCHGDTCQCLWCEHGQPALGTD